MISLLFYKHGWRWAFGPFFIGWNHQDVYTELRIGRITSSDFKQAGGMTWAEHRQARKQAKAARLSVPTKSPSDTPPKKR